MDGKKDNKQSFYYGILKKRLHRRFLTMYIIVILVIMGIVCPFVYAQTAPKTLNPSVDFVINSVGAYMRKTSPNPDFNSVWEVIDLYRSGLSVPASYGDTFYDNTVNYLIQEDWSITRAKYTEYSKLILGMTAIGKDARDIYGHNLLGYLSDFSNLKLQGFNGPVWALIALKSNPAYEIPIDPNADEQTSEEGLITYILDRQTTRGGWTLMGNSPDVDITGMTIQALAPYYGKREDITKAVDKAVERLYLMQLESGGFSTMNVETSESCAQVIVALSSIGIDCVKDQRFVYNGNWPMSRLFDYYLAEGGFMHVFAGSATNGGGEAGTLDGMATEQGMYATIAYKRMLEGKTALYDMSDVTLTPGGAPTVPATTTEKKENTTSVKNDTSASDSATMTAKDGTTTTSKVKVTKLTLNYKQITLTRGKTRTLKLKVTPSNATNKKAKWTSSNKKVVTVTQKGKVKAVKAGRANITVTSQDGSGKKAVCKVVVKNPSSKSGSSGSGKGSSTRKVKVTDVSLSFKQISVAVGASRSLTAVVTPSNATNRKLTWSSSNKSIATVSQSGTVTGKRSGTVTITAKAKDGSGKSSSCTVIVYGAGSGSAGAGSAGNANGSNGSSGSGQTPQGVQQRINAASGQQGGTANSQGNAGNTQGTGSQPSGSGATGQTAGASGNSGSSDGNSTDASTEAGAWFFDGEAYVPESSGSSNGEADVWLADGEPFPAYDAGQESAQEDTEAGYMENPSEPEAPKDSNLSPWLSVLLGLVVPGGLAGSFKVPWQTVGDRMLLLAAFRKKE